MFRAAAVLALALVCSACPASRADIAMSEQIIQMGDGLNDLRQDTSALQQQMDSLRLVVAKQDTVIRQLANLAGVPLAR
jgi:predicted lipoprotein